MIPVYSFTRVLFTNAKCTRGRGCNGHPAFPTPSLGGSFLQRLGRFASRGRNRFCTWGTVIARSEATKQSILSLRLDGLLRFARNDDLLLCVVPAKAGTHNPRRVWLRKVFASVPYREDTAYGSRRSPGRRWAALRILTATNSATENSAPCLQTPACWRGGRCCRFRASSRTARDL